MNNLCYRKESWISGSSWDQPSIRISKIKSASYISCIHRMRYDVDLCRKVQNKTMYLKITESFNELSVNTDTIDAENDMLSLKDVPCLI